MDANILDLYTPRNINAALTKKKEEQNLILGEESKTSICTLNIYGPKFVPSLHI